MHVDIKISIIYLVVIFRQRTSKEARCVTRISSTTNCITNAIDIKIINLSDRQLSKEEENVLGKGQFTSTPTKRNILQIREDISEFTRKIRLAEYFHGKDDPDDSLVKNKTKFISPLGRNISLNNFVKDVENIPLAGKSRDDVSIK